MFPSTGIRDHLPPAAACRTEGRRVKIPAIILNHETGAFVIPFCNRSHRTQNTRESAAQAWTAPVSWIFRAFQFEEFSSPPTHFRTMRKSRDTTKGRKHARQPMIEMDETDGISVPRIFIQNGPYACGGRPQPLNPEGQ